APFLLIVGRASRRLGRLAVDDFRLLDLVGLGRDGNGAGLHRLGQFAHQVDVQQAVLEYGALHQDMIGELESPLEAPRSDTAMQESGVLLLGLLLAANGESVLLHVDGEVAAAKAGHGHGDAIVVLADALDIVGRVARGLALEAAQSIQQRAEPVEADGGAIKWGKIKVPHDTSSLRSDMVVCPLVALSRADGAKPSGLRATKIWVRHSLSSRGLAC